MRNDGSRGMERSMDRAGGKGIKGEGRRGREGSIEGGEGGNEGQGRD